MEAWRKAWRAIASHLPDKGIRALMTALETGDERLIRGGTTCPPPLQCVNDWPCEGACAVGFAFWQAHDLNIGEVEQEFARVCFHADQDLGEPAGCRHFLNWWDSGSETARRADLLAELKATAYPYAVDSETSGA